MKTVKMVCAGFGGQGVLSMGQMVALMAMKKGFNTSWMPSYGPEMRGGTANCQVVIDEAEIASPIVSEGITLLLAMNQMALTKFQPKLEKGAWLIVNSALVDTQAVPSDVHILKADFNAIAQEVGNPKVQNMAALGTLAAHMDIFNKQDGLDIIEEKFGKKNPELTILNQKAFEKAYDLS
jgi:2-oxoglutarate ferredoxin oxidoreductase subunit gamma